MRDCRGKRIDNGEFVYGSLQKIQKYKDLPPKCYILQPDGFKLMTSQQLHWPEEKRWKQDYIQHEVDPKTVGQYTSRKATFDKKKIYQGDIIRYVTFNYDGSDNGVKIGYVEWSSEVAAYIVYPYIGAEEGEWLYVILDNDDEVENIGNRWDNPDLLGG
ncbi:YopX protein [compost metagenome]